MYSILVLMVHNRLDLFKKSVDSIFSNTNYQFSEILICNDGSNRGTTKHIFDYVYEASGIRDINLMHFSRNQGQGCILEFILNYVTYKHPKYLFLLEQDYIWRKNWAEEAVAVLENSPRTIMVPGASHPDFYAKGERLFSHYKLNNPGQIKDEVLKSYKCGYEQLMLKYFNEDLCPREYFFQPFNLEIKNAEELQVRNKIQVQASSNSTTCNIINWHNFHQLREDVLAVNKKDVFWIEAVQKACGIGLDSRKIVDDAYFSQGISHFWYKAYGDEIKKDEEFAILDICDFSIGNHLDGGGHHSKTSVIGVSTEESPRWKGDVPAVKRKKSKAFVLRAPYSTSSGYETLITTVTDAFIREDFDFYIESVGPIKESNLKKYKKYFEKSLSPEDFNCPELFICPMQVSEEGLKTWGHLPDKKRTLITMWEASKINSSAAVSMGNMEKIIVPNHWNKRSFEEANVAAPVHVVPLFVDTETFKYKEKKEPEVFLFGAGNSDRRKHLDEILEAFLKAFPSDKKNINLIIKGSVGDRMRRFTDDRIKYVNENFTTQEMADWYSSLDCFVSVAAAEGWGLMQHEAMACGTVVMAPLYAGLVEFMNQENCYPLEYKEVLADIAPWNITSGGLWSEFNEDHLIQSMRHCYNNRKEAHEKGRLAAEQVKEFTIKNTIDKIKEVMECE